MSQTLQDMTPNIKSVTEEEEEELRKRMHELSTKGDYIGVCELMQYYPLSADSLNGLKEDFGLEFILKRNLNVINAVKQYGEGWVKS